MRILILLLVAGLGFLAWQQGWLPYASAREGVMAGGTEGLEAKIANRIEIERFRLTVSTLARDAEIQKWLVEKITQGAKDPEALSVEARHKFPQYQDVRVMQTSTLFVDGILDRIATWSEVGGKELTHFALAIQRGKYSMGWEATVLVGLKFPVLTLEALQDGKQSQFYSTCTLCQQSQPCSVPRSSQVFKLRCQHCQQVYAMVAADTKGHFRNANEFLTGFAPTMEYPAGQSKYAEIMQIWREHTSRFKYLTDGAADNSDAWQTGEETRSAGQGDCEDSAILLTDWLLARGFQARVAIGLLEKQQQAHAWVALRLDGNDYVMESTQFPFGQARPMLVAEALELFGDVYIPELQFDRESIYVPKKPTEALKLDYWSDESWLRVPIEKAPITKTAAQAKERAKQAAVASE
jgi:predicted transglutaminase-like cysteine proteinase